MAKNGNLHAAKVAKNDEFYTMLSDIEKEMAHYREHFKGKTIFCNCDDPTWSNFWRYFHLNFGFLELKKLISTHFDPVLPTYKLEYEGGDDYNIEAGVKTDLKQNGDFRSPECVELLKESDIVITNEPFSLLREYVAQLMQYEKKFLIIANMNAITYKEIFPLIKNGEIWLGYNSPKEFGMPGGGIKKFGNVLWFTNLDHPKRHEPLVTGRLFYNKFQQPPGGYLKYDNFDAINVNKTMDIPMDYDEIMGVPVSFLDKYCVEQFEIIWQASGNTRSSAPSEILNELGYVKHPEDRGGCTVINGKRTYGRLFIRKRGSFS